VNTNAAANPDTADGPGVGDVQDVRITVSDLFSEEGRRLPAEWIRFHPDRIFLFPEGGDSTVIVTVSLPRNTVVGNFHGVITAAAGGGMPHDEVSFTVSVRGEGRLEIVPNPVYSDRSGQAVFSFRSTAGMEVEIEIFTMALEKVISLRSPTYAEEAMQNLVWHLENDAGTQIASGMYVVLATFNDNGAIRQDRQKIMVLR